MRQPGSSSHRRYADYGHMPHTGGTRGNHTPSRAPPDVVVDNSERKDHYDRSYNYDHSYKDHYDRSSKDHHDRNHYVPPLTTTSSSESPNVKLGTASNPNRSDMPPSKRKGSYDPVSVSLLVF